MKTIEHLCWHLIRNPLNSSDIWGTPNHLGTKAISWWLNHPFGKYVRQIVSFLQKVSLTGFGRTP